MCVGVSVWLGWSGIHVAGFSLQHGILSVYAMNQYKGGEKSLHSFLTTALNGIDQLHALADFSLEINMVSIE